MRYLQCPETAEVIGLNIHAFYDNEQRAETLPVMQKYGFVNVEPMGWYKLQDLLNSLNELLGNPNFTWNMVAIGMKIGEVTPLPPGMTNPTLEDVLNLWDEMYQSLHQGGDVGKIICTKITETHYKTVHTNPYPDDMSYGILYAYGRRFLPANTQFKVYYEASRDEDEGDETIIHIEW